MTEEEKNDIEAQIQNKQEYIEDSFQAAVEIMDGGENYDGARTVIEMYECFNSIIQLLTRLPEQSIEKAFKAGHTEGLSWGQGFGNPEEETNRAWQEYIN